MFKQKFLLATCAFCFVGLTILGVAPAFAAQNSSKEPAQGDGDVTEVTAEEQLLAAQQLADEEKENPQEDVATVTAEGDFLLPTYLLPVAEEAGTQQAAAQETLTEEELSNEQEADAVEENTAETDEEIEDEEPEEEPKKPVVKNLKTKTITKTKTTRDLPIVMVKQTELIPVSEQMEVERRLTGSTEQTQQIYEDALNRQRQQIRGRIQAGNQITAAGASGTIQAAPVKTVSMDQTLSDILGDDTEETATPVKTSKPLLLPLKPKKTPKIADSATPIKGPRHKTFPSKFADKILDAAQADTKLPLIMPMDLKVSFYPNAAEFSGQTVKWIKAFSMRALQDPRYVIEIRLSNTNPVLQQKRLVVVEQILKSTGLSSHQITAGYVNRPTDSMILRTIKKTGDVSVIKGKGLAKDKKTINW